MNRAIQHFEKATGLGATQAARLLGLAYPTYAQIKSGLRPLQAYHARHIEALLLLPRASLDKLIQEHVHGKTR